MKTILAALLLLCALQGCDNDSVAALNIGGVKVARAASAAPAPVASPAKAGTLKWSKIDRTEVDEYGVVCYWYTGPISCVKVK